MDSSTSAPSAASRWRRLPRRDRRVVGAAIGLLPASALALRHLGFRWVYNFLGRAFPVKGGAVPREVGAAGAARVARVGQLVDRVAVRLPGRPGCLPRSLSAWALLRREGVETALRIGVRLPPGSLEAHAWVEPPRTVEPDRGWIALPDLPDATLERPS